MSRSGEVRISLFCQNWKGVELLAIVWSYMSSVIAAASGWGFDMLLDFKHHRQGAHVAHRSTTSLLLYAIPALTDRLRPDMEDSEQLTYVLQFGFLPPFRVYHNFHVHQRPFFCSHSSQNSRTNSRFHRTQHCCLCCQTL